MRNKNKKPQAIQLEFDFNIQNPNQNPKKTKKKKWGNKNPPHKEPVQLEFNFTKDLSHDRIKKNN